MKHQSDRRLARYFRRDTTARLQRVAAAALTLALVGSMSTLANQPSYADTPVLDGELKLLSTATRLSGLEFNYEIQISCSELTGSDVCNDIKIQIPIPAALGVSGATDPIDWEYRVVGVPSTINPIGASVEISADGLYWEITLDRNLDAGEAPRFSFHLKPPAGTTPDQTQWALSGTVSGVDSTGGPLSNSLGTTAVATVTASAPCAITPSAEFGAVPLDVDRAFTFAFSRVGDPVYATGALGVDPNATPTPTVTIALPSQFTFVKVTDSLNNPYPYTLNSAGEYVFDVPGFGAATSIAPTSGIRFTLTAPSTPVAAEDALATATMQYTAIGKSAPITCTASPGMPATGPEGITGFWSKRANPWYGGALSGLQTGSEAGANPLNVSYGKSDIDPGVPQTNLPFGTRATSQWFVTVTRQDVDIDNVYIYDGMPCLTNGNGTLANPYTSLPEGNLCTSPAFRVDSIGLNAAGFTATAIFTDGSTQVFSYINTPPNRTAITNGKLVAAVVIEGNYPASDPDASKQISMNGFPVASLPKTTVNYLRNFATLTPQPGSTFTSPSTQYVGMQTVPEYALLKNLRRSSTHAYAPDWTASQTFPGTSLDATASDPTLLEQRRLAVVFPAGSGINVLGVNASADTSGVGEYSTLITRTGDYDGQGSTRYLVDLSQVPFGGNVGTLSVDYGGMMPGVYTYYTYSGFTGTGPTDDGVACVGPGKKLITDLTGIIGPVGVPTVLCEAEQTILVTSTTGGFDLKKTVSNVSDGTPFLGSPSVVLAEANDMVQFRVRIANISEGLPLTNLSVYDLLPHLGDTGIRDILRDRDRESEFTPVLTGVQVPDGWTAAYTTSFNPCRPELSVTTNCDPDSGASAWRSTLPKGTTRGTMPGAIRLTTDTMPVASYVDLILEYQMPPDVRKDHDLTAWNNVAGIATFNNSDLLRTEAPKVGFTLPTGEFDFEKTDSQSGKLLSGSVWELVGPHEFDEIIEDNVGQTDYHGLDTNVAVGAFHVAALELGGYVLTEIKAPANHKIDPVPHAVPLSSEEIALDAGEIPNDPVEPIVPLLAHTGSTGALPVGAVAMMLLLTGIVFVADSRRRTRFN